MTAFTEVYSVFLSKLKSDSYLASLDEDDLESELYDLMVSAIPLLVFPKVSMAIGEDGESFTETFSATLKDLLAEAMVNEWLARQINDLELIELKYSTRDFQLTSQANQLKALRDARLDCYNKLNRKMDNYHRQTVDGKSVFSGM